jgi:hypothetical protein
MVGCQNIDGVGGVAGLACTMMQCGVAGSELHGLDTEPLFIAVGAAVGPSTNPLAKIFMPGPRESTRECALVNIRSTLWMQ